MENILEIIGQIFGLIGTAAAIASFQMKENRKFFIFQGIMGISFVLNYLFLGELSGCFMEFFCIVRAGVFALGKKGHGIWALIFLEAAFVLTTVFTYNGWLSIVLLVVHIVGTYAMWSDNGKIIRFSQLFCVSPGWLIYNIAVFSIGGIICEVMNIVSAVVSFIRFGLNGFSSVDEER